MRAHGMTLAQIARIPPDRLTAAVRESLQRIRQAG